MFSSLRVAVFVFVATLGSAVPVLAETPKRPTLGWVEKVTIEPGDILLDAKLDTGADSSSLDAKHVEEFERDGANWVRFDIRNRYGKTVTIEKQIRRVAIIKRHHGKHQKRRVIRIGVCVGAQYLETDVTLIDRTNFAFQMLLGRNFLAGHALVDPATTYTTEPSCNYPKVAPPEATTAPLPTQSDA